MTTIVIAKKAYASSERHDFIIRAFLVKVDFRLHFIAVQNRRQHAHAMGFRVSVMTSTKPRQKWYPSRVFAVITAVAQFQLDFFKVLKVEGVRRYQKDNGNAGEIG